MGASASHAKSHERAPRKSLVKNALSVAVWPKPRSHKLPLETGATDRSIPRALNLLPWRSPYHRGCANPKLALLWER
jgi:hypothetical protein